MRLSIFILMSSFSVILFAQEDNYVYKDHIFLKNIATVYFDLEPGHLPIINKNQQLHLIFDDMDGDIKEYIYRIYHCNKDWIKTDINELEFTDGINESYIENYQLDNALYSDYSTYDLYFPNDEINLLLSGNYIIEIYDNSEDEEILAITKRFIVVENKVGIEMSNKPIQAINYLHNQEINFSINYKHFPMVSPSEEVSVSIFQNGNWSTGIHNIKSEYIYGSKLNFGTTKPIVFPGLKEFRKFDIRSLRFASEYVEAIDRHEYGTDVLLKKDTKRYHYYTNDDLNGSFVITNNSNYESEEYANVVFNLKSNVFYDDDIYVFGKLSQWNLSDKFKMHYDEALSLYIAEVPLKQGVYDYMYAMDIEGKIDLEVLEGSSSETINVYSIIVYYTTINEEYDKAIGVVNYTPNFRY